MRREFFKYLYLLMQENPNIWALTGDLGYKGFDQIMKDFPQRFINCGASEFSMVGIAAGLALEGQIPFCYTITPFYYRAFEMIRTYIDYERIPVILVGSGRDQEYIHDGYSHNADDVPKYLDRLPNLSCYYPKDTEGMKIIVASAVDDRFDPSFISLSKTL